MEKRIEVTAVGGKVPPIKLTTGFRHVIVVKRPVVHMISEPSLSFGTDRKIFLPFDPDQEQTTKTDLGDGEDALPTALDVVRTAYETVRLRDASSRVVVAGHCDTVGGDAANEELSRLRAENVQLFLAGERAGWSAACKSAQTVADWQTVLTWSAEIAGWNPHPGPIDDDLGHLTKAAIDGFRHSYNAEFGQSIPEEGPFAAHDWEAVFDVYQDHLAEQLAVTREEFKERVAELQFADPSVLACGESFPAEQAGRDDLESRRNRRVEILFLDPASFDLSEEPLGKHIYSTDIARILLLPAFSREQEPLGRASFQFFSRHAHCPEPDVPFRLVHGEIALIGTTDEEGVFDAGPVPAGRYTLFVGSGRAFLPTVALDKLDPYPLHFIPEWFEELRDVEMESPEDPEDPDA